MSSPTTDETLWQKVLEGNQEAYSELFHRYKDLLLRYGYSLSLDRELIKDSIQDLFLDVWKRREKIGEIHSVKHFFLKSFRRILLRKIEQERRKTDLQPDSKLPNSQVSSTETRFIENEEEDERKKYLSEKINSLPARQREIIFLRFYKGLTHDEIASIMEIQKQAAWNLLSRALNKLRTLVDDPRNAGLLLPFMFFQ